MNGMVKSSSDENQALTTHTRNDRRGSPSRRSSPGRRVSPKREESIETRAEEGY
jgi:hypothetical protein